MGQKSILTCMIALFFMFVGCQQEESFDPSSFQLNESLFSAEESQSELNQRARNEFERSEKNMNRMLAFIYNTYRNNTILVGNIRKSQDAWNEYRDFHMKCVFPGPEFGWGSMYKMSYFIEKSRITWLRARDLYKWVAPGKGGESFPDPWHGSYGMVEKIAVEEK